MATYSFDNYYGVSSPGGNVNTTEYTNVSFEVADGDTLDPGESTTIEIAGVGSITATYQGMSDAGEPYFTGPGNQWYFASDTVYQTQPPETAPPINVEPFEPVCFLAGTLIATPEGQVAVEELAIGDLVLSSDGRSCPVLWIGRQTVAAQFAVPARAFPIRITAGALADGLPARDLLVSPDHAVLVDGVLIQAAALVNGTSIRRETSPPVRFTYYHIELEDHALVLAEGAAAETFVDNVTRRRFDNYAEFETLFGDCEARVPEMDHPRVKSARQLPPAIKARLAARVSAADVQAA